MNQYNLTGLYDEYLDIADSLDAILNFVDIIYTDVDGNEYTAKTRTYDRNFSIGMDALHYRLTLKLHTYLDDGIEYPDIENLTMEIIAKEFPKDWRYDLGR